MKNSQRPLSTSKSTKTFQRNIDPLFEQNSQAPLQNLFSKRDFILDCTDIKTDKLPSYNGLYDKHLIGFFERAPHRKNLRLNGIIDRQGRVLVNTQQGTPSFQINQNVTSQQFGMKLKPECQEQEKNQQNSDKQKVELRNESQLQRFYREKQKVDLHKIPLSHSNQHSRAQQIFTKKSNNSHRANTQQILEKDYSTVQPVSVATSDEQLDLLKRNYPIGQKLRSLVNPNQKPMGNTQVRIRKSSAYRSKNIWKRELIIEKENQGISKKDEEDIKPVTKEDFLSLISKFKQQAEEDMIKLAQVEKIEEQEELEAQEKSAAPS